MFCHGRALCSNSSLTLVLAFGLPGYRRLERVLEDEESMPDGSFYIRVNLNILGHVDNCSLQVKCDEILHVLDTGRHTKYEWLCARVDPFTKKDLEHGTIPSYS
eukprot:g21818.t1